MIPAAVEAIVNPAELVPLIIPPSVYTPVPPIVIVLVDAPSDVAASKVKFAVLKDSPVVAPNVKSPPIVIPVNFVANVLVAVPDKVPPLIVSAPFPNALVPPAAKVPALSVNPPAKVPPAIANSPAPFLVIAAVAAVEKP